MEIIHCINLNRREDRLLSLVKQSKEQGAALRIWEGVETEKNTASNINKAHRQIVQWAKENNQERVVIAEDDIIFSCPTSYEYFLSQVPKSFHMFFGMLYSAQIKEGRVLNGFSGMTLYMVHNKFYDFFLSIPHHAHIDRWLGQYAHEKEYYVCDPYVCLQSGGYSDNLRQTMFYDAYTDSMKFYGRDNQIFSKQGWINLEEKLG